MEIVREDVRDEPGELESVINWHVDVNEVGVGCEI